MDNPLISVIVPVYKVEPYLRRCLDSIVGQTYRNLEIILVDDGSPDNCGAICDEYAAKDGRIKVIHQENRGLSAARNAGLELVSGQYIGFLDSDDWIELDMYSYLLQNIEKYCADIAVCGRNEIYKDKSVLRSWKQPELLDREGGLWALLANDLLQNYCCDKLFRSALWEEIRFPEGRTFEDLAVMYRLFEQARLTVCLPEAKYNYFQRAGGIVADQSLRNRFNHYWAAKERYEKMREAWPQMTDLLLAQCTASAIGLWCAYYSNPREERILILPKLKEISDFCREHIGEARKKLGLGLAGRMALRLIPYPKWWAFALARLVSKFYEWKHGRPL